jgi:excisionase family DNA binding protein
MLNTQTLLSAQESALAKLSSQELFAVLANHGEAQEFSASGQVGDSHQVTIPASALELFIEVLTQLGQGNSVRITPVHAELTTQEAADLLNMSRPTLIKLFDANALPHSRKGNRRKIAFVDVMKYKNAQDEKRLTTLDELSELDQEMNTGY